jgi:transcriptional regulator with XRE-family HTH domain
MALVRQELGDVLRDFRQQKGRTLRQIASRASVALGYLSEVERGQKEASSEILASVAEALEVPVSVIMRQVSDRLAQIEGVANPANLTSDVAGLYVPDTVPAEFLATYEQSLSATSR